MSFRSPRLYIDKLQQFIRALKLIIAYKNKKIQTMIYLFSKSIQFLVLFHSLKFHLNAIYSLAQRRNWKQEWHWIRIGYWNLLDLFQMIFIYSSVS